MTVVGASPVEGPLTLLAFAPMIDSELSRLILDHYGLPYAERDHLFGWASLLTLLHGGFGQVPFLYGGGIRLSGPRAIVDRFDERVSPKRRLLPAEPRWRQAVEEDWRRYHGPMGTDSAVVAYFHLLPARERMIESFSRGIPAAEKRQLGFWYGAIGKIFELLLRLSPGHAGDALQRIRIAFEFTDRRVADGRKYLAGDRLTLADLSLITAASPLLLPDGFGAFMPRYDELPEDYRRIVDELRLHPTAEFVQRFYSERRTVAVSDHGLSGEPTLC